MNKKNMIDVIVKCPHCGIVYTTKIELIVGRDGIDGE